MAIRRKFNYSLGILKLFFRTNDEGRVITMSELRALADAAADRGISGRGHFLDGNDALYEVIITVSQLDP